MIAELVSTGSRMLCSAGGFELEHPLLRCRVRTIDGYDESVRGLPVKLLSRLLNEVNIS